MITGMIWMFAFLAFYIYSYNRQKSTDSLTLYIKDSPVFFYCIFALALVLKLVLAYTGEGFYTDMTCFRAWTADSFTRNLVGLYRDDYFCDYPPLNIYIFYIVGAISHFLKLEGAANDLLIKLPSVAADMLAAFFIFRIALKRANNYSTPTILATLYLFNPAIIINSSSWGQMDGIYTMFLMISLYMLATEKYYKSAALYAFAILLKPQSLMFGVVYLFVFILKVLEDRKWLLVGLKSLLIGLAVFFAFSIPFMIGRHPSFIFNIYANAYNSYPMATFNAFNLYAILGLNYTDTSDLFLFMPIKIWGHIFTIASMIGCGIYCFKAKHKGKDLITAALLIIMIFALGVKMHERYLFPAIAFLLAAYAIGGDRRLFSLFGIVTAAQFINVYHVYYRYAINDTTMKALNMYIISASLLALAALVFGIFYIRNECLGKNHPHPDPLVQHPSLKKSGKKRNRPSRLFNANTVLYKLPSFGIFNDLSPVAVDLMFLLPLTLVYSIVAFVNLGDTVSPTSARNINQKYEIMIDTGQSGQINYMQYFQGIGDVSFSISTSNGLDSWQEVKTFKGAGCFAWHREPMNVRGRYINISITPTKPMDIYEIAFFSSPGNIITHDRSDNQLFDEPNLVPETPTYKNSMYFDEIYHGRTAYEHLNQLPMYENTHPPLGKLIISVGISLFGMNPFGWRFMGTIFGILMIPSMYLLGKKVFKNSFWAFVCAFLMSFDLMHFTQTRIATIDTYGVFFIILMYCFMFDYMNKDAKSIKSLFLSGLFMGLGVASKWIGIYAGFGLAILFAIAMYRRYKQDKSTFMPFFLKTCAYCIAFFLLIPAVIYIACYIPIWIQEGTETKSLWDTVWLYQKHMFSYHSKLVPENPHPFSSQWYKWPIITRPIWYYGLKPEYNDTQLASSIVALGNPLIWWTGIVAFFYMLYKCIKKEANLVIIFLLVSLGAQYLPWAIVSREVYIYHFFASVPFMIVIIALCLKDLAERKPNGFKICLAYLCGVLLMFVIFYPIASGMYVPKDYITNSLRWFESWVLCY